MIFENWAESISLQVMIMPCAGGDSYFFSVVFYVFNGLQEHFVVSLMKK